MLVHLLLVDESASAVVTQKVDASLMSVQVILVPFERLEGLGTLRAHMGRLIMSLDMISK